MQDVDGADAEPHAVTTGRLLTPSKITAWLDCEHYLSLQRDVEAGRLDPPSSGLGSFARLVMAKGLEHEHAYLEHLRDEGLYVAEVPAKEGSESFATWAARYRGVLAEGHDVVYQLPMVHDGLRGVADFLIRVAEPSDLGDFSYEPVDAKLARSEAKPGHVLQLCFYADALEALQGRRPAHVHLQLGSGERETIRLRDVESYWRRLRAQLRRVMTAEEPSDTAPEPCAHCEYCEFAEHCDATWREEDALHFVAGLRSADADALRTAGVTTLSMLADRTDAVAGVRAERLERLARQAALQRDASTSAMPPYQPVGDGTDERGSLPAPDAGDVLLDFEGHPFWTPARGLFFLFGLIHRDDQGDQGDQRDDGTWVFRSRWAHSPDEEAAATADLIRWIADRRERFPDMHVYHYNHTERSALVRLSVEYGVECPTLGRLIADGVFVDLLDVVTHAVQIGVESYGLKSVEPLAEFVRGHDIDRGSGAVLEYDAWTSDRDHERLGRIARYNEDDVRATLAVRDWLIAGPLAGAAWRPPPDVGDDERRDIGPDHEALVASGEPWKVVLAHLMDYWGREGRAHRAQRLASLAAQPDDRLTDPDVVSDLVFVQHVERTGRQRHDRLLFEFPAQEITPELTKHRLMFPIDVDGVTVRSVSVDRVDVDRGELVVAWPDDLVGHEPPDAMAVNDWVGPQNKPAVIDGFAREVVELGGAPPPSLPEYAILRAEPPRFVGGHAPAGGNFGSDIDEIVEHAARLDGSYLAVQGPPGTGKTYTGAHVIRRLVADGRRVGVTAFSHAAIDNLLREALDVQPSLRVLRQGARPTDVHRVLPGATYGADRPTWDSGDHDVIAGTSWLYSRPDMQEPRSVDVLIVDEAGQMGLADALAASRAASNVILLGDPLQLPQVCLASHPAGAGASVLEHVLAGAPTVPADRGVFLDVTRRMHDSVCSFISEQIYEGRLDRHPDCDRQSVGGDAGLRWVRAEHAERSTSSPEEAALVAAAIRELLGTTWVDMYGRQRPMTAADVMVVAPYNDHVNLLRATLGADPGLAAVRVGTVDRFQGQEAAAVVFSMATSSGADRPRNVGFLFSRERLNVAISRARAVATVVCTDELLDTRARSVDEMRLVGTLCAFRESAREWAPAGA